MTGNSEEISLYIHVPFCSKKCPYCHFFVLPDSSENQAFFLEALQKEWLLRAPLLENKDIVSVYFGGGTPSLLTPKAIGTILSWIKKNPSCEITLEVNPEKMTKEQMKNFALEGINRVSIGVQSFDDTLLKTLGRTHQSKEAKEVIENTWNSGITNISIDLMYELPHQTVAQWEHSLQEAVLQPITHLSLYNLVFEPGTSFYKHKKTLSPHLPSQEHALLMLERAVDVFTQADLLRYEISAFAKEGYHSRHNIGYWIGRPFVGIGPSAFSYLEGRRFQNTPHLKRWAEQITNRVYPESFEETLDPIARQKELLAIALRLLKGVDLESFTKIFGPLSKELASSIQLLLEQGLLEQKGKQLFLTKNGCNFYDSVATEII